MTVSNADDDMSEISREKQLRGISRSSFSHKPETMRDEASRELQVQTGAPAPSQPRVLDAPERSKTVQLFTTLMFHQDKVQIPGHGWHEPMTFTSPDGV